MTAKAPSETASVKDVFPPLSELDQKISETKQRNFSGSLEQSKEELRDAYMNFKDLQQRCLIGMNGKSKYETGDADQQVYYFKPETFLLDEPEKQRIYRDSLLKKVGNVPKPEPINYLGDELHRSMCQTVADRSTPNATKAMLASYFQRRQYSLQHMKYKLLCRWAHHNLTSETIEMISPEATFLYGKLEFNLEQAMSRYDRLSQQDNYDTAKPENRPSTQAEMGAGALYVENFEIPPQSLIREDDVEVYVRGTTYRNKINKTVNKFMSRLKWLPMHSKYQLFEKSIESHFNQKKANIQRQQSMHDRVKDHTHKHQLMNAEMEQQLNEALSGMYCKKYEQMFVTQNDQVLHGWKANHDEVPKMISNNQFLKIKIIDAAAKFNLLGDIELDQGFSFSYQITVFFPSYFQRQVVKSQFSVYDAFAGDFDPNEITKRNLYSMAYIDSNIFRDVSTTKSQVPSDEAIQVEFKHNVDVKIMRLKSCAYWIDYVALTPQDPDWHQKQQAILNCDNPIDSLLESAFNFLDVNDLATVNRINEDNSHLHKETIQKLTKEGDPHNLFKRVIVPTSDGDKPLNVDRLPHMQSSNEAANIESHLLKNVQSPAMMDQDSPNKGTTSQLSQGQQMNLVGPSIQSLPSHLLTSYYTLRFITSRDAKTKVLYCLNYFRAIQKRIALDLREFATRDRIDGQSINPFTFSTESNQTVLHQVNMSSKTYDKRAAKSDDYGQNEKKMMVFDFENLSDLKNMASLRHYKCNGLFNNKVFSTCPSFPKFHSSHGEPLVHQPMAEEQDRFVKGSSISENSVKLMCRIDFIELNEKVQEVYVKDDLGLYIMFDCALQDMKCIEDELCKIGSYFLHKGEVLLDPKTRPYPSKDRQEIVDDILVKEAEFQFHKVRLVQNYMECYEHVVDPLEQQKLMQIITDIMARRPRLNLQANYFVDAYNAEIECLEKQFELVRMLIDLQITLEKTENRRLQDSLNLSYYMANLYSKDKWRYQDAQTLLTAIEKTRQQQKEAEMLALKQKGIQERQQIFAAEKEAAEQEANAKDGESVMENIKQSRDSNFGIQRSKTKNENLDDQMSSSDADVHSQEGPPQEKSLTEDDYFRQDSNQFTNLLGLPSISIESIYQSYKENDENVIQLMKEHSNFITVYEGYPEFLTMLTHRSILDKNRIWKSNNWSQETGALDFYDSLDFINRFFAISDQVQQELYDSLKMWDNTLMTQIDLQVAEFAMEELRKVIAIQDGSTEEYAGRELVEDESIMGNADKLIFFAKEMIGDLTCKPKQHLDPFIIAKLDLQTINFFNFPAIKRDKNRYTQRNKGIAGIDYIMRYEKTVVTQMAKDKVHVEEEGGNPTMGAKQVADSLARRNIAIPTLLKTYCNMAELLRLRQEIILAVSETSMLTEVYKRQCELVGERKSETELNEGISFDYPEETFQEATCVNYFEHGPSHHDKIDLAIREFDPLLLTNFNFRNPDSFRINLLTAGLEEVRAILHYQVMQKQMLIVATRANSLILDSYERAISELNLLTYPKVAVPNALINYAKIMTPGSVLISPTAIKNMRQSYKTQAGSSCTPVFFNILAKKNQSRSSISKEFSNYLTVVQQAIPGSNNCVNRVMRCFRVKLLTQFAQKTLTDLYLNSQKVQAVQSCHRLRNFNRMFKFDPKALGLHGNPITLFKYETSPLLEPCPYTYLDDQNEDEDRLQIGKPKEDIKVINPGTYEIVDFYGIPSSATLLSMDATPIEDIRLFIEKRKAVKSNKWNVNDQEDLKEQGPQLIDPEQHLKRLLPTFTPTQNLELLASKKDVESIIAKKLGRSAGFLLDYEEALYFGDSKFAQISRFYRELERIFVIEWFMRQLQFKPEEIVNFDHAIKSGLPFFKDDHFDARVLQEIQPMQKSGDRNNSAQEHFIDKATSLRQKRNVADQVQSLAIQVKNFIAQYVKTKEDQKNDYLTQYTQFRYQQIVGSLHKLIQNFYHNNNIKAVKTVQLAVTQLTKMDHTKIVHLKPHNYSVRNCAVAPNMQSLESGSLIHGAVPHEDTTNFIRCVQPVLNQKALEPGQITLFQSMYQQDLVRQNPTQFAGQYCSTSNGLPFQALQTALIALSPKERQYSQTFIISAKYQANDFMETVYDDTSMGGLTNEDVYSLGQLILAKKFMNENTTALLLRNALICWFENSTLPDSGEKYEQFESNFRQNFFWKQLKQKEFISKKISMIHQFGSIPTQGQLEDLKLKIDKLVNDQNLATVQEEKQRDELVKALQAEFGGLKKKVTLDNYYNTKAEITVFSNEIEKLIIEASVKTLDAECHALTKCFTIQVPTIQYHIHPFQQFAATFFDKVDPNATLDVSNKVNAIQELLTKMRNRSTEVETLTSGPGLVITIKDISEILIDFSRTTIMDQQKQFKSRGETSAIKEGHLRQLVYVKDQKIKNLEHRIGNINSNLENIVNSRLFEKGNQLIYELDSASRILNIFKNTMYGLENKLTERILGEQLQKFKRKNNQVEMKDQKFSDYKQTIMNMIEADFAAEQDRIKTVLKDRAEAAKITEKDNDLYKKTVLYPASGTNTYKHSPTLQEYWATPKKDPATPRNQPLPGTVVPQNFRHYPHCFCYVPNPKHPWPTMELAELDMLSEQEARNELSRMCILIRKQRLLYRTKEMCLMTKYQAKINILESQQNSNVILWEQLAESDKRERVIKQELVYTQQSLSDAQKTIENLQAEIKTIDAERCRLQKFKQSKVETLKELENVVKKIDLFANIDSDKLVQALTKKDAEVKQLLTQHDNYEYKLSHIARQHGADVSKYRKAFNQERTKTQAIVDKMEQLKLELKMLEQNDSSVTSIWKKKCLDLFEVCQSMKKENEELRDRCFELITQGLYLTETLVKKKRDESPQSSQLGAQKNMSSVSVMTRGGLVNGGSSTALPDILSQTSHQQSVLKLVRKKTSDMGQYSAELSQMRQMTSPISSHQQPMMQMQSPVMSIQQLVQQNSMNQRDIMSEETNVPSYGPSDGMLNYSNTGQHSQILSPSNINELVKNQRGKSVAQLMTNKSFAKLRPQQVMSPKDMRHSQDIRSILNGPMDQQVMYQSDGYSKILEVEHKSPMLNSAKMMLQNAVKRRSVAAGGISQDMRKSLLNQSADRHKSPTENHKKHGESPALTKLKSMNRFNRLSNVQLDLQGTQLVGRNIQRIHLTQDQIYPEESDRTKANFQIQTSMRSSIEIDQNKNPQFTLRQDESQL